jgi:hypothetical protein
MFNFLMRKGLLKVNINRIFPYFAPLSTSFHFYEGIRGHLKNRERKHIQLSASVPLARDTPMDSIDF